MKTTNPFLPLAALFLLVFGAKAALIATLGSTLPYSDQWLLEGSLYRSYLSGSLDLGQLFAPLNEHRMVFSRLLLLGLFEVVGGWDPVMEMLVNALIHSGFVVGFVALLMRTVPPSAAPMLALFSALCFALPIGYENTLIGINAHFYLLLIFSFGSILLMVRSPAFSPAWLAGLLLATASNFTLASGALTPVAVLVMVAAQLWRGARPRTAREWAGAAAVLALSALLLMSSIQLGSVVKARGIADFLWAFLSLSSLPLLPVAGLFFVHAPIAWFAVDRLRAAPPRADIAWGLIGLAVWVIGQVVAVAYGRAAVAMTSRYFDMVLVLLPLDFAILCGALQVQPAWVRRFRIYAGVWVFLVVAGLGAHSGYYSLRVAGQVKALLDDLTQRVVAFERSGDLATLSGAQLWLVVDAPQLAALLSDQQVRAILPPAIRPPDADGAAAIARTALGGRLAGPAGALKLVLLQFPLWLSLGAAAAFLLAFRRRAPA